MAKRQTRTPRVDLNQPLSDQPWYVKTLVWVGVPSVAFGYLLWVFVEDVSSGMKNMRDAMDAQQKAMSGLVQHLQEDTSRGWALVSVAQRICLNTAKSEQDKLQCVISMERNQRPNP